VYKRQMSIGRQTGRNKKRLSLKDATYKGLIRFKGGGIKTRGGGNHQEDIQRPRGAEGRGVQSVRKAGEIEEERVGRTESAARKGNRFAMGTVSLERK